jgi:predicted nucleotide-binding protein (sugar kinase/HSP70/actin superfamily)
LLFIIVEYNAFLEVGKKLNLKHKIIKKAYEYSTIINNKKIKKNHIISYNKLKSDKPKVLVVSHPYNVFDEYIGKPIIDYLSKECEVIISSNFRFERVISLILYFKPKFIQSLGFLLIFEIVIKLYN